MRRICASLCVQLKEIASTARRLIITTSVRKPGGAPDVSTHSPKILGLLGKKSFFPEELCPTIADVEIQDHLVIASPRNSDWNNVNLYDAFTVNVNSVKVMFLNIPSDVQRYGIEFRESLLALLELAESILGCRQLFVCFQKNRPELATLVHAFLYVGFTVSSCPLPNPNSNFVSLRYVLK